MSQKSGHRRGGGSLAFMAVSGGLALVAMSSGLALVAVLGVAADGAD